MSTANRPTRKASDAAIVRLNSIGISLATIAARHNCHPTGVTLRLKSLGVPPTDTRRSFMEDVLSGVSPDVEQWLADQITPEYTIKDFVRDMLLYVHEKHTQKD